MNRGFISTPLLIGLLLLVGGAYFIWAEQQPNAPIKGAVPTPTPATVTTPAPTSVPAKVTTPPAKTTSPTNGKDSMTASPKDGLVPLSVTFTLHLNSNRTCARNAYTITFGEGVEKDIQVPIEACNKPYSINVYHQYEKVGSYTATLFVGLPGGVKGVSLSQATITTRNPPVTVKTAMGGTFTVSPSTGTAPLSIDFSISATDGSEYSGVYYSIVFGDGESAIFPRTAGPKLSHVYARQGSFVAIVSRQTGCSAGVCSGPSSSIGSISIPVN